MRIKLGNGNEYDLKLLNSFLSQIPSNIFIFFFQLQRSRITEIISHICHSYLFFYKQRLKNSDVTTNATTKNLFLRDSKKDKNYFKLRLSTNTIALKIKLAFVNISRFKMQYNNPI